PAILILDEPTVGLDPVQIRETLATIKELGQTHTILLSTHILSQVEAICERVIIINAGRIGLDKKLADLESAPTILLDVRGPAEQVANVLKGTEGVDQVTTRGQADGLASFEIRTRNNADLREAISQRVVRNGWGIRRLDLQRQRLEDRFMEVLREEDPL